MIKNYYQILGLKNNCSKEEIKKAYRIYATKYHPDKQNNDKFFEERFKEIKEAYDILTDNEKRADFDSKFENNFKNTEYKWKASTESPMDGIMRQFKEIKDAENVKRKKIYYTSKDFILNGLYIYYNRKSYKLSDYDKSTIRKDDNSKYGCLGFIFIIIGILTISFFIGILVIFFGVSLLFYKDYFIVLISKKGEVLLIKGNKFKMKKISKIINLAIEENNK